ncbi:MAG: SUF system NifU family Fe-S cluster assembly protein [Dehalococcoidia bacterium]|jgi:nitrogen fixation NifU-like protein|nr:SUF system NifU family Fe-S cluster assembly protein [Dehalococcoidia bacterium]
MPDPASGSAGASGTSGAPDVGLDDLYRDILLDHYRSPRNHGQLDERATHGADGSNPLCGDELRVELAVEDGAIADVAIDGRGCSISQASASMMSVYVRERGTDEALRAVETFQQMMVAGETPPEDFADIEALMGVAKFPVRVKCASLAWKTLEQALTSSNGPESAVTTDERSMGDD